MNDFEPGERIPVGILGATGAVGQRFLTLLSDHPWFRPAVLVGSERSSGKRYRDAVTWAQEGAIPAAAADLVVRPLEAIPECRLLFSALDAKVAGPAESELARAGHLVVSNARSHRMDPDVPLVVPEVNPDHLALVARQSYGEGGIVTNPNCSTIGLTLALKPLVDAFGVRRVRGVTLQALSGAGLPGVPALSAIDNVVPLIPGEEDKLENEPRKIFGQLAGDSVRTSPIEVSAQCHRVPVVDGHQLSVFAELEAEPSPHEVEEALRSFRAEPQARRLPSAPLAPVVVAERPDRPQPRLDRQNGDGMSVTVGRVRACPLGGVRFVALSHNTIRGAAGGSILLAELALARGLQPSLSRDSRIEALSVSG